MEKNEKKVIGEMPDLSFFSKVGLGNSIGYGIGI